eukprot:15392402-Alexandrium_andersonii.AAC.1
MPHKAQVCVRTDKRHDLDPIHQTNQCAHHQRSALSTASEATNATGTSMRSAVAPRAHATNDTGL